MSSDLTHCPDDLCYMMVQGISFETIDVIALDQDVYDAFDRIARDTQPSFSFPQIYVKGKLMASLDMIREFIMVRCSTLELQPQSQTKGP